MNLIASTSASATIEFSRDELRILGNIIGEMCGGIHIDTDELETRVGASRQEIETLMARLDSALLDRQSLGK